MANRVYIKGSPEHPEKVVEALKKYGAVTVPFNCTRADHLYYVNNSGSIAGAKVGTTL